MKQILLIFVSILAFQNIYSQNSDSRLDFLVFPNKEKSQIIQANNFITLTNGLVKRSFFIGPNLVCMDYQNLSNQQQLIRAIQPEAKITINGISYHIGGLHGQKERAYLLPEWLSNFTSEAKDFQFMGLEKKTELHLFSGKIPHGQAISNKLQENILFYILAQIYLN